MHLDPQSAKKLIARIADTFDDLPGELRKAAEYVASHPNEVAFRSMRSVAAAAKVSPSTMVRLARALKLDGFDDLRAAFQVQLETRDPPFAVRARKLRASGGKRHWLDRVHALVEEEVESMQAYVHDIDDRKLADVGAMLTAARRVYVVGLRGMFPAAFAFHYSATMFSEKTILVDGSGGTSVDVIRRVTARDVVLLFTCQPYPVVVTETLAFVQARGAKVIAVTDGPLSPAARVAAVAIFVAPTRKSLLSSAAANVLASHVLAAVFLAVSGKPAEVSIRETDEYFSAVEVYSRR